MYKKISACFALSLVLASPILSAAKEGGPAVLPPGAMYRYTNDSGRLVMTSTLPKEAIYLGYEIIDSNGRLLEKHEKALPEAEREAANERRRQLEKDQNLTKLYPTPEDALRARDRKIDAIKLKISYAKNNIAQLNQRMNDEVSAAAQFEKVGQAVPETNQAAIAQLARQTKEQERQIQAFEDDIETLTTQFAPIIQRLNELGKRQPSTATPEK